MRHTISCQLDQARLTLRRATAPGGHVLAGWTGR